MNNSCSKGVLTVLLVFFLGCNNKPVSNTFLIPAGSEGTLRVVFSEKCGIAPEVENGRRTLVFPKSGLLVLSVGSEIIARKDDEFFLVDDGGKRTKVATLAKFSDRADDVPGIVYEGAGVSSGEVRSDNGEMTRVSGGAEYADFNLYDKETTEIKNSFSSERLDSLTNDFVKKCRAGE